MNRLVNLLEVAAFLSMVAVGAGLFGRWHFLLDLGSHFRIQAAGVLIVSGLVLHFLKRPRWSKPSLVIGTLVIATLLPYVGIGNSRKSNDYRLLTMNVLTGNPRQDLVIDLIIAADPDFIVLQETSAEWIATLDSELERSWPHHKAVPRSDNFGIAIYSKYPFDSCDVLQYAAPLPTPTLSAIFQLPNHETLRVITTHPVPPMNDTYWRSRNSLFSEMATDVASHDPQRTIVAGDLNCTPFSHWFGKLLRESRLKNTARHQELGISWLPIPLSVLGIPIDHVLAGSRIAVQYRYTGQYAGSDHRPVVVDFSFIPNPNSTAL